jgi:hypothetical protein
MQDIAPRNLAPSLWVVDRPFKLPVVRADVGTRMTIIRLADGTLFLHSPVKLDKDLRRAVDALGPVSAIVAPSKTHHLFVRDYIDVYRQARVYCAPGLPEKRKDLAFHAILSDDAPPQWRGQLEQHLFRGAPALNEVVFFHPASRTVVFTDLIFNLSAERSVDAPMFFWLLGAPGHFGPHRLVRLRAIRDRVAARRSIATILRWDFDRVIVAHGDVLETGGWERVASAFAFLP